MLELAAALFAGGILCGALWELSIIQRILLGIGERAEFPAKKRELSVFVFVLVQDVSFFVAAACVIAVAFYYGNNGNFRIVGLLFAAFGAVAYVKTVGRLTEKVAIKTRKFFVNFWDRSVRAIKRIIEKFRNKKLPKAERKNKEAIEIGKHQNCKIVGNKGGGKRAFHKG